MEDIKNKNNIISSYKRLINRRKQKVNKVGIKTAKVFIYTYLLVFVIIAIYPFVWSILQSFNKPSLMVIQGANPIPPTSGWTTSNYEAIFQNKFLSEQIGSWFQTSIMYALFSATLNAFFNFLGGYALARLNFAGKKPLIVYLIVSIIIPAQATQIPSVLIFTELGLFQRDMDWNVWFFAILFKGMANIVLTFQIRQFYLTQSVEVEEAGRMDGLTRFKTFYRLSIRQMLPLFAMQWTLVFMGSWNDFMTFVLFSNGDPEKFNLTMGILTQAADAKGVQGKGVAMALTTMTFLPMFGLYAVMLKVQARGIKGGNK